MSYPQTCQCKEDWTDGTEICQECHLKRINTQADLHAVVDFIRETEKLEAQVAEWMGVANQQILRIQELEQQLAQEREASRLINRALIKYRAEAGSKGLKIRGLEEKLKQVFDRISLLLGLEALNEQLVEQLEFNWKERDSALAIARQAVGVASSAKGMLGDVASGWRYGGGPDLDEVEQRINEVDAFLARDDAKALKGERR